MTTAFAERVQNLHWARRAHVRTVRGMTNIKPQKPNRESQTSKPTPVNGGEQRKTRRLVANSNESRQTRQSLNHNESRSTKGVQMNHNTALSNR